MAGDGLRGADAMIASLILAASLPVTAILLDGSRVVGHTSATELPVKISANITTNVPLHEVRAVTAATDGAGQLVALGHGDPLRGSVSERAFAMQTALGPVKLPWNAVEELRVEAPTADVQWLTAAGAPGFSLARGGEINLTGGKAWTRQKFQGPVVVECEVLLANRVNNGTGWLNIALVAEASRRMTTERFASARLVYGARTKDGMADGVVLRLMHTAQDSTRRKGETPFALAPGAWHRVRFEVAGDQVRFDLNGRRYELGGVQIPVAPVAIELSSGESDTRWRVRNFSIR
jgi:hypothetical protein